ncbi:NmrA family NAD(P)-binding protein [Amycolatopsis keratiniphila]
MGAVGVRCAVGGVEHLQHDPARGCAGFVREPHVPARHRAHVDVALARAGATLARGDLDDGESLARASAGAQGVFSVQGNNIGTFEALR